MDRTEYTACMTPHMKGKGKTREERARAMCIGAKLCTGKASTEEEAVRLCEEASRAKAEAEPSGEPKPKRTTRKILGRDCDQKAATLGECLLPILDINDLERSLRRGLAICGCGKKPKKVAEEEQMAKLQADPKAMQTLEAMAALGKKHGTYHEHLPEEP